MIIDRLLPPEFLLLMGKYTQTCAHIEDVCWRIVVALQKVDWSDVRAANEAMKIKTITKVNKVCLAKAIPTAPEHLRASLDDWLKRIEQGEEARHMAVHGAWRAVEGGKKFSVSYFMDTEGSVKRSALGGLHHHRFSWDQLLETAKGADEILEGLVGIMHEVEASRRTEANRSATSESQGN